MRDKEASHTGNHQSNNSVACGDELRTAESTEHGRLRSEIKLTDCVTALATVVVAAATVWNVVFVGGQLREMHDSGVDTHLLAQAARDQARIAKEVLIATERPQIAVSLDPAGPITWDNGRFEISYRITLRNIGKAPATDTRHVESVSLGLDSDLLRDQRSLAETSNMRGLGHWTILSNEDRAHIIRQQVTREQIDAAAKQWTSSGTERLIRPVIVGVVYYKFGEETYQTGFIYEVGFWDAAKGITITAVSPDDGPIAPEQVRIRRHPEADGYVN